MGKTKLIEMSCSKALPSHDLAEPVLALSEANACSLNHWMMLLSILYVQVCFNSSSSSKDGFLCYPKIAFQINLIDRHFFVVILYSLGVSFSFKRLSSSEWKQEVIGIFFR